MNNNIQEIENKLEACVKNSKNDCRDLIIQIAYELLNTVKMQEKDIEEWERISDKKDCLLVNSGKDIIKMSHEIFMLKDVMQNAINKDELNQEYEKLKLMKSI